MTAPSITKFEMNVPTFIRDALARVRQADQTALVAGGCLRDTVFGVTVKDVDVFVGRSFDPEVLPMNIYGTLWEERGIGMISYGSGGGHRGPLQGWTMIEAPGAVPVQIIRREFTSVADLLSDLDFGFCQIAFDGSDVLVSDAFRRDYWNGTATYTAPDGDDRGCRAVTRAARLGQKYPGRLFVGLPVATS